MFLRTKNELCVCFQEAHKHCPSNGIVGGHAYTVTGVSKVRPQKMISSSIDQGFIARKQQQYDSASLGFVE